MKIGDLVTHRGLSVVGIITWLNPMIKDNLYESIEVYLPSVKQTVYWNGFDVEVLCK